MIDQIAAGAFGGTVSAILDRIFAEPKAQTVVDVRQIEAAMPPEPVETVVAPGVVVPKFNEVVLARLVGKLETRIDDYLCKELNSVGRRKYGIFSYQHLIARPSTLDASPGAKAEAASAIAKSEVGVSELFASSLQYPTIAEPGLTIL